MDIRFIKEIIDYGILGLLALMGFIALWVYFERLIFFRRIDLARYRRKEALESDLTANITILSSIGSSAPYIGLLGTVLGIMITFYMLGQSRQLNASSIMISLSLALKATAMGLAVAIPSMLLYNHLARKIEVLQNSWEILKDHGD